MLIADSKQQNRFDGIGVLYNFLGMKSVCKMFSTDYSEEYNYDVITKHISSFHFFYLKQLMQGWIEDVDKAISLYAQVLNAVQ